LTSALGEGKWSASRPCRFTVSKSAPGIHWVGTEERKERKKERLKNENTKKTGKKKVLEFTVYSWSVITECGKEFTGLYVSVG
jgi:hypothetical protein